MSEVPVIKPMSIANLPGLKQPLEGGVFLGVITLPDNTHRAIVMLNDKPDRFLTWKQGIAWARGLAGELPSRAVAFAAFFAARELFNAKSYWTAEARDSTYAWRLNFENGDQWTAGIMDVAPVFAVRLIPLVGDAETDRLHERVQVLEARFAHVTLQERVAALEAQASQSR